jgi:nicotinic acid phosphoribosyltransferase
VSTDRLASPLLEPIVLTDLYEATMALPYMREGMTAPATFSLFVRNLPPDRGFLVALRHRTMPGPSPTDQCRRGRAGRVRGGHAATSR